MPTISEILREAVEILTEDENVDLESDRSCFTCDCVDLASYRHNPVRQNPYKLAARVFLYDLGLPSDAENMLHMFEEFTEGEERQYARALWLTLAAHIAEDEGL